MVEFPALMKKTFLSKDFLSKDFSGISLRKQAVVISRFNQGIRAWFDAELIFKLDEISDYGVIIKKILKKVLKCFDINFTY